MNGGASRYRPMQEMRPRELGAAMLEEVEFEDELVTAPVHRNY